MSDITAPAPAATTPVVDPSSLESQSPQANSASPEAALAAGKQAPKPAAKEALMAAAKKQYKIKVDHGEENVDFDPSNEDEVRKHLQLSRVAQKRMQESSEMRKGVQELLDTLRTNPLKILTDPRLKISESDRHKLAEAIMNEQIQEMAKTPEQKDKERLQKEYERLQQEVKTEREAREAAETARLQEQASVQFDTEISSAIETSGLPKNARTVRYFAEALKFCVQNDLNLNAKDLIPYVKKQALGEFREVLGGLSDDDFESFMGKDGMSRVRKRNMSKAAAAIPSSPNDIKDTGGAVNSKQNKDPAKKISYKDFFKPY